MIEAVRISETSVIFNVTTRRYIPEDSKLHTRRRENLKSYKNNFSSIFQMVSSLEVSGFYPFQGRRPNSHLYIESQAAR
jgi:hypothetical protein